MPIVVRTLDDRINHTLYASIHGKHSFTNQCFIMFLVQHGNCAAYLVDPINFFSRFRFLQKRFPYFGTLD